MPGRVTVFFRGRPRSADPDLPLWMALGNDRLAVIQRSIRYHRPRAPFCGRGFCTQCLVRVNGQPNVRACEYFPRDGDRVETENAWPSPRHDVYAAFDVLFPNGLDTVHGFRRPAFLTRFYHRVIRRLAGFGTPPDHPPPPSAPGGRRTTRVLVVGGGRSGTAAERALQEHGVPTVLVADSDSVAVPPASDRINGRTVFLPAPDTTRSNPFEALVAQADGTGVLVSAQEVILAPGGYDANLVFPGNDRPGVMTADGALRSSPGNVGPPFSRALLFGGDERARAVLERFPESVEAVAAPGPVSPGLTRAASERGIRLYPRVLLLSAHGRRRVHSVTIQPRGSGGSMRLSVDAVVLAHRRLPSPQLLFQAGARMHWDDDVGHYLPDLDPAGHTSVPGLFAAGEVAGFRDPTDSEASGLRAANAIVAGTPPTTAVPPAAEARPHFLESYYRELLAARPAGGKCLVCPCEDVLLKEVEAASAAGYRGVEVVKRFTGVGTGLCQGRYCVPETLLILSALERRPPAVVGYLTQRPPVVPVPLGLLANLPPED